MGKVSVPNGSTSFWLLEAEGHIGAILLGPYYESILLLLIAVILGDVGLEELSCGIVLRRDKDLGFFLFESQLPVGVWIDDGAR